MTLEMEKQEQSTLGSAGLARAFGLGWAAADEAHLPGLPRALAQLLELPASRLAVIHWNGTVLLEYAFNGAEERRDDGPLMVFEQEEDLGTQYRIRLSVESPEELTAWQSELFTQSLRLIHAGLECLIVRQRDRDALGKPFSELSDREWLVCQALERPNGEKEIASTLEWSRHTVHSYVKRLYRKLMAQSRLQLLDQLRVARQELRLRTLDSFGGVKRED